MQESFIRKDHVRSGRLLAPQDKADEARLTGRRAREALRAGFIRALQALGALRARFLSLCKPQAREAMSPSLKRTM